MIPPWVIDQAQLFSNEDRQRLTLLGIRGGSGAPGQFCLIFGHKKTTWVTHMPFHFPHNAKALIPYRC
jgi:hypothetical protein